MHPSFALLVWTGGVILLQTVDGWWQCAAVAAVLIAALGLARPLCMRLLRRIRFLLLAVFILFGLFTPGRALIASLPGLSPSYEGIRLALEHGGRLLGVVCAVALLLTHLPPGRLVSGLYGLMRPFGALGLPARGLAVRILLVLREVAAPPAGGWRGWLAGLHDAPRPDEAPLRLDVRPFSGLERAVLAAATAMLLAMLYRGL